MASGDAPRALAEAAGGVGEWGHPWRGEHCWAWASGRGSPGWGVPGGRWAASGRGARRRERAAPVDDFVANIDGSLFDRGDTIATPAANFVRLGASRLGEQIAAVDSRLSGRLAGLTDSVRVLARSVGRIEGVQAATQAATQAVPPPAGADTLGLVESRRDRCAPRRGGERGGTGWGHPVGWASRS